MSKQFVPVGSSAFLKIGDQTVQCLVMEVNSQTAWVAIRTERTFCGIIHWSSTAIVEVNLDDLIDVTYPDIVFGGHNVG